MVASFGKGWILWGVYLLIYICSVKGTGVELDDNCVPDSLNLRSNLCYPCSGGRSAQTGTPSQQQPATHLMSLKMYFYGKLNDMRQALNNTMTRYENLLVANEWTHARNFSFDDVPVLLLEGGELPETAHAAVRTYDQLSTMSVYMKIISTSYTRTHGLHTRNNGFQSHMSSALCFLKRITARIGLQIPRNVCRKCIIIEKTDYVPELASWIYAIVKHSRQTLEEVFSTFLAEEAQWQ